MGYHYPRSSNSHPQGYVQGGQDSGHNEQRTSRSHSLQQQTVQTGHSPTLNRSASSSRSQVSGQAQPYDDFGAGQHREPALPYVPPTNTAPYIGTQGQIQSPPYQDPSQTYPPASDGYFPVEGSPTHLVLPQGRTPPQQSSVPHTPSHSTHGQYPYQRGDAEYSAGHPQQRRPSSSQYQQQQQPLTQLYSPQQQQQQPSTQLYSQPAQSSTPPYQHQQQPSTQPYSPHQQPLSPQQRRPYQPSPSQRQPQQTQQSPSQPYTQPQQPQPIRQQGNFATAPDSAVSSFVPNVPGGNYETPVEEIRQSRSMRRGTSPLCRLSTCNYPAIRDGATQELTEYCSLDHMQADIRRGATLCPACSKCPRRNDGNFCGSRCEKWDQERQRQSRQQLQHYPGPPPGVRPTSSWAASGETSPVGNFGPDDHRLLPGGGLVLCPKCNNPYTARGRSNPRFAGQGSPVDVPLPPCPTCGYRR